VAGADGIIAVQSARLAAPDGYTLFVGTNSAHGANPALYTELPCDPDKDFEPVPGSAGSPRDACKEGLPCRRRTGFRILAMRRPSFQSAPGRLTAVGEMSKIHRYTNRCTDIRTQPSAFFGETELPSATSFRDRHAESAHQEEISVLRRRVKSLRAIAAEMGCAVNTVRRHLGHPELPHYAKRQSARPKLGAFEAYLRDRIVSVEGASIPASVLAREIRERGYEGSDRQVLRFIRELRPHSDQQSALRGETAKGKRMQVQWIDFGRGELDRLALFVAFLGWSRASYVEYLRDWGLVTLLACHRRAFEFFGGVPRTVVYGSNHAVFVKPDAYGPERHQFDVRFLEFARHHGFLPRLLRPCDHKSKADMDRISRYVRYSFHLPLVTRLARLGVEFDVDTANAEVRQWLRHVANGRAHGAAAKPPAAQLELERGSLLPLPRPCQGGIALPEAHRGGPHCADA
jgi:transposase